MPYRSVRNRLSQSDTWLLETFLGLYTLVWGANYANPLTEVFVFNPRAYVLLAQFPGGEAAFGLTVVACGSAALMAATRGSRSTRAAVFGTFGLVWLAIAVAIGVPTGWSGGVVSALMAIAHWFCWARLRYSGLPT